MLLLMLKNQPFSRSEEKNSSHFVFVSLVKVIVLFYYIFKNGKLRTGLSSFVKTIQTGLPFQLFNFKWQAKNSRGFFLTV